MERECLRFAQDNLQTKMYGAAWLIKQKLIFFKREVVLQKKTHPVVQSNKVISIEKRLLLIKNKIKQFVDRHWIHCDFRFVPSFYSA